MNSQLIHLLEDSIRDAIWPIHDYINMNVLTKQTEAGHLYCELSVIFKLKTDEQVADLIKMFQSVGSQQ